MISLYAVKATLITLRILLLVYALYLLNYKDTAWYNAGLIGMLAMTLGFIGANL